MVIVDKFALTRQNCRESFYHFLRTFWSELIRESPTWNWHILFLCNELQEAAERVFRNEPSPHDYVINVPPGTTKSTILSIMYPAWIFTRMLSARIIVGSHTDRLALDLSNKCREVVKCEKYRRCFGDLSSLPEHEQVLIHEDQDTKGYWATTKRGFRLTCTVAGQTPTGFHAHFLIVDDPIDPEKATSELEIQAANSWMNGTLAQRKVDSQVAVTFIIMQRLSLDDPSGYRIKNKELGPIRRICLPAELSEHVYPRSCRKFYKDGLLDPVRLPLSVLKQKRGQGIFFYSGQYRQWPVPLEGGMFHVAKLHFGVAPPPFKKFRKIVRYWDKAATQGGGKRTAGVLIGEFIDPVVELPVYWILHVKKGQWSADVREKQIKDTAAMDGIRVRIGMEQEPGSGGKESANFSARRLSGYNVTIDRVTGDKIERWDPLASQVNEGNVWIAPGEWNQEFVDEMEYASPLSSFKDQVDAACGGFAMLTGLMKGHGRVGTVGSRRSRRAS